MAFDRLRGQTTSTIENIDFVLAKVYRQWHMIMLSEKEKLKYFLERVFRDIDEAIIEAKGDTGLVRLCNDTGETAFHYVVIENRIDLAKRLLDAGSDVNTADCSGATPLMHAIELKYIEMTKWLIENGASLEMCDVNGNTALSYATTNDLIEIFNYLIEIPRKEPIDYYYPVIETKEVLADNTLLMRKKLIELGLGNGSNGSGTSIII